MKNLNNYCIFIVLHFFKNMFQYALENTSHTYFWKCYVFSQKSISTYIKNMGKIITIVSDGFTMGNPTKPV
jgi:small-conductance mechanosensitive channel